MCAQVCVLKKIQETNVNVKEQRVGESHLRAIDSVCGFLFFPQLHEGEQKACTFTPSSSARSTPPGFVYSFTSRGDDRFAMRTLDAKTA